MFDDVFLDSLPENPIFAGKKLLELFQQIDAKIMSSTEAVKNYDDYLIAYGVFQAFCETYEMECESISITGDKQADIQRIRSFIDQVERKLHPEVSQLTFQKAKDKFLMKFGKVIVYRFSDGDVKKIQTLINELRYEISNSTLFDDSLPYTFFELVNRSK